MKKTLRALTALAAAFALTLTACQAQPAAAMDTALDAPAAVTEWVGGLEL